MKWRIPLVENNKLISDNKDNTKLLTLYFVSNAVKIPKIPEFSDTNLQAENISHPIYKVILKYKNNPSIITIKNTKSGSDFYFCKISLNDVFK